MKDIKDVIIKMICNLHALSLNEEKKQSLISESISLCEEAMKYYRVRLQKERTKKDVDSIILDFKENKKGYAYLLKETYSYLLWMNF